jgi:hypothetical protein
MPGSRRDGPVNRWHRNSGIIAAAGLLYLLTTGLPLQFSGQLQLGQRFVTSTWVLDWYGLQAPDSVVRSGGAVHVGDLLFWNDAQVGPLDRLTGALTTDAANVAAGSGQLVLLHQAAPTHPETIRIGSPIVRLGQRDGALFLDTEGGLLAADDAMLNWQASPVSAESIQWSSVEAVAKPEAERYRRAYRERMLHWERWLQDLHSGRFFGTAGVVIIDLLSMLLVLLAATGLVLWLRYPRGNGRARDQT